MKKILDVSRYQDPIDYAAAAKQVDGVILRAGLTGWGDANQCQKDPLFERHYAGFKAVGLPVGAYYYSAADTISKAREEAEFCKRLLAGKSFELPIYIDIENPQRMEKLSREQLTAQVEAWAEVMEAAGYFVGVYANTDYFTRKLDHPQLSGKYTVWLADYRAQPNTSLKRDLHQFTSRASVSGISGGVDMSDLWRDNLVEVVTGSGLNGTTGSSDKPNPVPDHALYIVRFGPATAGDRDAAVALGNGLQLQPKDSPAGTAPNGRELYMVDFIPMTGGDRASIEMLGDRLDIDVQVRAQGTAPTQRTYTVQPGDSWWKIAAEQLGSGSRMYELADTNDMSIEDTIHPGQVIKLP